MPDRLPALEDCKVRVHALGRSIALARIDSTRFNQDFIQFENELRVRPGAEVGRQLWELTAVESGSSFVKDFAQRENVGLRRAGPFRRQVTFRAHDGSSIAHVGHQPDVCQLWAPVHENDVGRFHIAMHQTVAVEVAQRFAQGKADFQDTGGMEAAVFKVGAEAVRGVEIRSSKAEIRRKPEFRSSKFIRSGRGLGIRISDFLRYSGFGFRIFERVCQLH